VALILDANVLYAALDRGQRDHATCRELIASSQEEVVIPSPVLVEVDYFILKRMNVGVLIRLLHDIVVGSFRMAELEPDDYFRIDEIVNQYPDSDIGFVDAAVLAIVERLNEPKLATLDYKHFAMMRPRHVDALTLLP
jgi:predicted nucleic acid-binding protein